MNPQPQNREPVSAPSAEEEELDLRLPADDGGDDDDAPWEDDDHDVGKTRDGSEDVGLDAADASDEPIEIAVHDEDEGTRWTDDSEAATDVDADPDLLGGAEDGWIDGAEPLDDIDMGVDVDDDDESAATPDGGEEGLCDEGSFDGISQLPPLDASPDDAPESDDEGDEPFARELLLDVAGGAVADDDVLVDASGRTWSRAPASIARVQVLTHLDGLVARERSGSCLTREGDRLRWWSRAEDGTLVWSDDCGRRWSRARGGPKVVRLCSDGAQALAMLAHEADGAARLHCSSDNGRTWDARDLPAVEANAITELAICRDVVVLGCSAPEPRLFASVSAGAWRELGAAPPCALLVEDERVIVYACLSHADGTPLVRYPLQGGTPPLVATVLEDDAAAPLALCAAHEGGATALHVWSARAWSVVLLRVEAS